MATDQPISRLTGADASGFVVWLTGLPSSGKSTLACAMQQQLLARGIHTLLIDSDELRAVLTPNPTFSEEEREWFYGIIVYLAAWLARNGVNVLIAATANRRAYRAAARAQIERFAEVYVNCPVAICRLRDTKGIYIQAAAGLADHVPGVGSAYEEPLAPEAIIDTGQQTPEEAATIVLTQLAI